MVDVGSLLGLDRVVGVLVGVGSLLWSGGVVGVLLDVGALPHTGSPGTGPLPGAPARNTTGIHAPPLLLPTQAHQSLVRPPTEYVDPSDWHRNGYR